MPQYRESFFLRLSDYLKSHGVSLDIYYGDTPPEWKDRNDAIRPSFAFNMPTRFFPVLGRVLIYKSLESLKRNGPYDLVIIEHAIRNLESYQILVSTNTRHRTAFWGHGKNYTESRGSLETRLKDWLLTRAAWYFAYTEGGASYVRARNSALPGVSVVRNSIDVASLLKDLAGVTDQEVAIEAGLRDLQGRTALYIGGLDKSKRIDVLMQSADEIYRMDVSFRLIVAGDGTRSTDVREWASTRPWVSVEGAVFGRNKALLFRLSQVLMNPGRVGLVAVDSIVTGVPIITLRDELHAPEFEYLSAGHDCVSVSDAGSYPAGVNAVLQDPVLLGSLRDACLSKASDFSAEIMAERFGSGVLAALSSVGCAHGS